MILRTHLRSDRTAPCSVRQVEFWFRHLSDLVLRSYAVPASMEVAVPPLQDYALTMHLAGPMTMDRRIDVGPWKRELLVPGTAIQAKA